MPQILSGILIGSFVVFYLANLTFRHVVNIVLIFAFKIPVYIFEFIDRKTCNVEPCKPAKIEHQKISPKIAEPKPIKEQRAEKQTSSLPNFSELDTEKWAEWIKNNPDLVSVRKKVTSD
jgi:hypothetical protein